MIMGATSYKSRITIFAALAAVGLAACGGEEEVVEGAAPAISSDPGLITLNCTAAERSFLLQAKARVIEKLHTSPSKFEGCLADAFISMNAWRWSPERIAHRLRDNLPTYISCVDSCNIPGAHACAQMSIPIEHMYWVRVAFDATHIDSMAAIMVHEVLHNKGFWHPAGGTAEYPYTVPSRAGLCMKYNYLTGRSDIEGEAELSQIGSSGGGQPAEIACKHGAFMYAARVRYGNHWGTLAAQQLTMSCRPYAGGSNSSRTMGTSSGHVSSRSKSCGSSKYVVGVYGKSETGIDGMGLICGNPATGGFTKKTLFPASAVGGQSFERYCPAGMAVSRIRGRKGAALDQLSIVCRSVTDTRVRTIYNGSMYGSSAGYLEHRHCSGFGFLSGLFGQSGVNTGQVHRIGGFCQPTKWSSSRSEPTYANRSHIIPAAGGTGGTTFSEECGPQSGLVGVNLRVGAGINRIQGICAKLSEWRPGAAGVPMTFLPGHGGWGGTSKAYYCAKGSFVSGLRTYSSSQTTSSKISGLAVYCRKLY